LVESQSIRTITMVRTFKLFCLVVVMILSYFCPADGSALGCVGLRWQRCTKRGLSKIDLMENMKRSTSRDFRINAASLEAALQELSDEEGADESSVHENSRTRNDGDVSGTGASNEGDAPVVLDLTNGDEPSITSSKKTKRDGFALPKPAKRTKLSSSSQRKPLSSLQK